jgi:hypothetical protein
LNRNEFENLSKLIVEIFETEIAETYYSPSAKGKVPTGKLYSSYSNLRNSLASVGLIARESKTSHVSSVPVHQNPISNEDPDTNEVLSALEQDDLENIEDKDCSP